MKILIFSKNPAPSLFSFHRPLATCQFSENNKNRLLENCVANERTDGRTNMTEFIGPSPINRGSNIGNSKELWKTLKKLGLPAKNEGHSKIWLGKEGNVSFDPKSNAETFKNWYANLAMDLVRKLPLPTSIFGTNSVK